MGYAARLNPRSLDGRKSWAWVERARLQVAPLSELVAVWVKLIWKRVYHV
jgi:hypothetical protein